MLLPWPAAADDSHAHLFLHGRRLRSVDRLGAKFLEERALAFALENLPLQTRRTRRIPAPLLGCPGPFSLPGFFLEETFTLSALREAYRITLGHTINYSAFRRKIDELHVVEPVPGAALTVRVPQRDAPVVGDHVRFAVDSDGLLAYPPD